MFLYEIINLSQNENPILKELLGKLIVSLLLIMNSLSELVLIIKLELSSNKNKYDSCFHAHDHLIIEEAIELIESS